MMAVVAGAPPPVGGVAVFTVLVVSALTMAVGQEMVKQQHKVPFIVLDEK